MSRRFAQAICLGYTPCSGRRSEKSDYTDLRRMGGPDENRTYRADFPDGTKYVIRIPGEGNGNDRSSGRKDKHRKSLHAASA